MVKKKVSLRKLELKSAKELHCPKCKADIDGNTIEVWTAK